MTVDATRIDARSETGRILHRIPVIVGPTASGKTGLSEQIAHRYPNLEIISADSRQVYIGMDIGTAKASPDFLNRVPHHLIDILRPDTTYSAGSFARDASAAIDAILSRGRQPLIVGGTGFYIRALFEGLKAPPAEAETYAMLERRMREEGYSALLEELRRVDPIAAAAHAPENYAKTLRALACFHDTGIPYSRFLERESAASPYRSDIFCLLPERALIYDRINSRVEEMIDQGLVDETERLLSEGYGPDSPGLRTVGYKEVLAFLRGEIQRDAMVPAIQQSTRRYAKRQSTWFRGQLEHPLFGESAEDGLAWFEQFMEREEAG